VVYNEKNKPGINTIFCLITQLDTKITCGQIFKAFDLKETIARATCRVMSSEFIIIFLQSIIC